MSGSDFVSELVSVRSLFSHLRFAPAAVQRNFQWGEKQADRLLVELMEAARTFDEFGAEADEPDLEDGDEDDDESDTAFEYVEQADLPQPLKHYYLGGFVFGPDPNQSDNVFVFDGLQRLTTLTILFCILRDMLDESDGLKSELSAMVHDSAGVPRLVHSGAGPFLVEKIQTVGEASIERRQGSRPDDEAGQRIHEISISFVQILSKEEPVFLSALATFLLGQVVLTATHVPDPRLARQIFVATNLYGKRLRRNEIFKGQLLSLAAPERADEFRKRWDRLRFDLDAEFDEFLVCFDLIERRVPQSTDPLGDLADHISSHYQGALLSDFFNRLERYAKAWMRLSRAMTTASKDKIDNLIWRMGFFKWRDWKPFALALLERYLRNPRPSKKTRAKYEERFEKLLQRSIVMTVMGWNYKKRRIAFLRGIRFTVRKTLVPTYSSTGDNPKDKPFDFSDDVRTRFKRRLRQTFEDKDVRRALMLFYETSVAARGVPLFELKEATVEHVLPQNPDESSVWIKLFPDHRKRSVQTQSLGNLCIVDDGVQMALGNDRFEAKLKILKKQAKKYASTRELVSSRDVKAKGWQPITVGNRTVEMANAIEATLGLA